MNSDRSYTVRLTGKEERRCGHQYERYQNITIHIPNQYLPREFVL